MLRSEVRASYFPHDLRVWLAFKLRTSHVFLMQHRCQFLEINLFINLSRMGFRLFFFPLNCCVVNTGKEKEDLFVVREQTFQVWNLPSHCPSRPFPNCRSYTNPADELRTNVFQHLHEVQHVLSIFRTSCPTLRFFKMPKANERCTIVLHSFCAFSITTCQLSPFDS